MTVKQVVTLVPLQYSEHSIDQILVLDDENYPVCMFFIGFFWTTPEHRDIHDKLSKGMQVQCELMLTEVQR